MAQDTQVEPGVIDVDPKTALAEERQVDEALTAAGIDRDTEFETNSDPRLLEAQQKVQGSRPIKPQPPAGTFIPSPTSSSNQSGNPLANGASAEANQTEAEARREIKADQADDEKTGPAVTSEEKMQEAERILVPKNEPRVQILGAGEDREQYVQRELSFIGKMQFFSLLGEVIDKAMSGENPMKISSLFEVPAVPRGAGGEIALSDFRDAEVFMQAVGKVVMVMPDFLEKCYCIWLAIPDWQRPWARQTMALPADEGGLSDDDGVEIIETFIDQNWKALEDFFVNKVGGLRDRVQARVRDTQSRRSKPSKISAPNTRNA